MSGGDGGAARRAGQARVDSAATRAYVTLHQPPRRSAMPNFTNIAPQVQISEIVLS
jgi:hypothetical protein